MADSPMMGSLISCHSMPMHTQYMEPFLMLLGRRLITHHRMQCSLHHLGRVGRSAAMSLTQFLSTPTNAASRAISRLPLLHHRHRHKLVGIRGSFVRQLSTCNSAKCTRAMRNTSRMVVKWPPPQGPWDDCFIGAQKTPAIIFGDGVRLNVESDCDHWVVYDMPTHALCLEPQSGPPDGFTLAPHVITQQSPLQRTMKLIAR